jgi:hypothetical protein
MHARTLPHPARPLAALVAFTGALLLLSHVHDAVAAPTPTTSTNVDTAPTGAEVRLVNADGTEAYLGLTPLKKARLPRGNIRLRFTRAGFEPLVQPLLIERATQTLLFNLVRTIAPAELTFASAAAFHGAAVTVDGVASGKLPTSVSVPPGRHQVVISLDGHAPWERWVEVAEGAKNSYEIVLTRLEAPRGSLLVSSVPSGAAIRINGAPSGITPAVIDDLTPGPRLVELTLADHQPFSQSVEVLSGQRAKLDAALARTRADTGDLKILVNVDDATVFLDGEAIGPAPVTRGGVAPGTHIVEARNARGFRAEATAEVRGGELTTVRLELKQTAPTEVADVRVASSIPGSTVSIDGAPAVPVPHRATGLTPGTHTFEVRASGYTPWRKPVSLVAGENPEILAELTQQGQVELRTRGDVPAQVFVDGQPIGRAPYIGELTVGTHVVLYQRDDGAQESFNIAVASDRIVKVTAAFGTDRPKVIPVYRPMPSSARALSPNTGHATIIATIPPVWAYPIVLEAGGGIGGGMDVALRFRPAFDVINELEAVCKWTFAHGSTVAAAVEGAISGGLGGDERSSFGLRATAKGSLLIGENAAITAHAGLLVHSDRLGPESETRTAARDNGVRMYIGVNLEFRASDAMNLLLTVEGDPLPGNRRLFTESYLSEPEPRIYPRVGAAFVF